MNAGSNSGVQKKHKEKTKTVKNVKTTQKLPTRRVVEKRPVYKDDDNYENDGFVVNDVDNCKEIQMLIRQMVRPQGYDPTLSISFWFSMISYLNTSR